MPSTLACVRESRSIKACLIATTTARIQGKEILNDRHTLLLLTFVTRLLTLLKNSAALEVKMDNANPPCAQLGRRRACKSAPEARTQTRVLGVSRLLCVRAGVWQSHGSGPKSCKASHAAKAIMRGATVARDARSPTQHPVFLDCSM